MVNEEVKIGGQVDDQQDVAHTVNWKELKTISDCCKLCDTITRLNN